MTIFDFCHKLSDASVSLKDRSLSSSEFSQMPKITPLWNANSCANLFKYTNIPNPGYSNAENVCHDVTVINCIPFE